MGKVVFWVFFFHGTVLFHYMDVGVKVPSGFMFLVICNTAIKNISYLILSLSYHIIGVISLLEKIFTNITVSNRIMTNSSLFPWQVVVAEIKMLVYSGLSTCPHLPFDSPAYNRRCAFKQKKAYLFISFTSFIWTFKVHEHLSNRLLKISSCSY